MFSWSWRVHGRIARIFLADCATDRFCCCEHHGVHEAMICRDPSAIKRAKGLMASWSDSAVASLWRDKSAVALLWRDDEWCAWGFKGFLDLP
jgi:hypothetical protein